MYTYEKRLIVKERKRVWSLRLEIRRDGKVTQTVELATFSKRPMALCAMAASVNSFRDWLMADYLFLNASAEGIDALMSVGIFDETCIAD